VWEDFNYVPVDEEVVDEYWSDADEEYNKRDLRFLSDELDQDALQETENSSDSDEEEVFLDAYEHLSGSSETAVVDVSQDISEISALFHGRSVPATVNERSLLGDVSLDIGLSSEFANAVTSSRRTSPTSTNPRPVSDVLPPTPNQAKIKKRAFQPKKAFSSTSTRITTELTTESRNPTNIQPIGVDTEASSDSNEAGEENRLYLKDEYIQQADNLAYDSGGDSDDIDEVWTRRGDCKRGIVAA
jgi:hypothetical protein